MNNLVLSVSKFLEIHRILSCLTKLKNSKIADKGTPYGITLMFAGNHVITYSSNFPISLILKNVVVSVAS